MDSEKLLLEKETETEINTITNYKNALEIILLAIISVACLVYIILIYHDIHEIYLLIHNASYEYNITMINDLHKQLEFIGYCVSEKYCKRIH
jgi:hypothetical protein